jgi:hypothetical protein
MTIDLSVGAALADELAAAGASLVLHPESDGYRAALTGFNLAPIHRPDAVVVARTVEDVVAAVSVANAHDLAVRVLGRGHGTPSPIDGGIVITTTELTGVLIDAGSGTALVRAGTPWRDVIDAAAPFGLAPLCGSAPDVGAVGFLLGGGIGPIARTYGFAADHVRSLRVVTAADGLVKADADFNRDLFWAARGGKGGFGVVVQAEIDLFPLSTVFGGGIYYATEHVNAAAREFASWSQDLPEAMTASFAILRLPDLEEVPPPLRGQTVGHLRCAFVGDAAEAEELVAPLRAAVPSLIDTLGELPYARIGEIHADPVDPMPVVDGGILLPELTPGAVERLLEVVGVDQAVPLAAVELRRLGGALARPAAVPNAVGGRDAAYALHIVGAPVPELLETVVPAVIRSAFAAVDPGGDARTQINFVGAANGEDGWERAWTPATIERLREVRHRHDPRGLFRLPGSASVAERGGAR